MSTLLLRTKSEKHKFIGNIMFTNKVNAQHHLGWLEGEE